MNIPKRPIKTKSDMPSSDPGYRSLVILQDSSHPVSHIWFYSFEDASVMTEFFHLVATAPEGALIIIHLANVGGSVHSGIQLIHNIVQAQIRGVRFELHIEAPNYSMASLFSAKMLSLGVRTSFNDFAYLMFHDYHTYLYGKGHEIDAMHTADKKLIRKFFIYCCKDLFSIEETDEILEGKDKYLDSDQVFKRLQASQNKQKKGKKK